MSSPSLSLSLPKGSLIDCITYVGGGASQGFQSILAKQMPDIS